MTNPLVIISIFACLLALTWGQPECFCLQTLASGIQSATVLHEPNDGTGRLFIGIQEGFIDIYYKNGTKEAAPFLDITDRVKASKERGLLGLETHPNFAENRIFYVFYTTKRDKQLFLRVSQFLVFENSSNEADPDSEIVMVEEVKVTAVHHAGQLLFDKDGYLLVFIGDGGPQGDPNNHGQNKSTIMAAALRLDVSNPATPQKPYDIPIDNPFISDPDALDEIYVIGLRNPWSAAMDPGPGSGMGRIFIGDVGYGQREEISLLERGKNFGWARREGDLCVDDNGCDDIANEALPIHSYDHSEGLCVIGGRVYRGCLNPSLVGLYIFADYGFGRYWYLDENPTGTWNRMDLSKCSSCPEGLTNANGALIYNFGQDLEGEVYVLSTDVRDVKANTGYIQRIIIPDGYEERLEICPLEDTGKIMYLIPYQQ